MGPATRIRFKSRLRPAYAAPPACTFFASRTAASVRTNLELGAASVPTNFEIGALITPSNWDTACDRVGSEATRSRSWGLSSSFNANVGDARVYGMESDIKYQANSFLSVELSASYNDSRVVSNNFANSSFAVSPGERLPYVPYFDWSGNVRYERPLEDALHGYVQYDVAHKGDMWNTLQTTGSNGLPRVLQPGYSVMNLRFGLNQTAEHWMTELYISNLLNKNAVIYTNEGNFDLRQTVNEPRVFGVRLSYRFGKQASNNEE